MGRRAKYQTKEERLVARRAQRVQRDSKPGYVVSVGLGAYQLTVRRAKEVRRVQNRRAWRKKRNKELLHQDLPTVPQAIRNQAKVEISSAEHKRLYGEFCEGRDSIELGGDFNIDADDFDILIGPGPYSTAITSNIKFSEHWPKLSAAIHGLMAYRYIAYCDEIVNRCHRYPSHHLISGLYSIHHDLVLQYNQLTVASQRFFSEGDKPGLALAKQSGKWISRLIVYTVEDMEALRGGCGSLMRTLTERRWQIKHGGNI